ncbi:MAG: pilus assembly protein PilO [Calothrix sp. C42_A2020_038]|nr:pilus assembly protein PilO [Calothrix sp. C42_A2020_038]
MTLSEDLDFEGGGFEEVAPSYPVVFGISFTPKVGGILIGLLGLSGAAYIVMNMVMPSWETFQQQQTKQTDLQGQIEQKKASIKQIDKVKQELAQAKVQQKQVLGLFANEKTLDTLLTDLNRLVESGNDLLPANAVKAKMRRYTPDTQKSEIITDSSFGPLVNNKLKRSKINIEFTGTYEQTQSILRNIERLQPLLLVKDYDSKLNEEPINDALGKPIRMIGPVQISTSFQLQALMPLTPEEAAAVAKPPAEAPK